MPKACTTVWYHSTQRTYYWQPQLLDKFLHEKKKKKHLLLTSTMVHDRYTVSLCFSEYVDLSINTSWLVGVTSPVICMVAMVRAGLFFLSVFGYIITFEVRRIARHDVHSRDRQGWANKYCFGSFFCLPTLISSQIQLTKRQSRRISQSHECIASCLNRKKKKS